MCTFPSYHKLPLRYPSFPAVVACRHKHKREISRSDSTFLSFVTFFFTLFTAQRMPMHMHENTDRCIIIYKFIYKNEVLHSDSAMTLPQPHRRWLQCSLPCSAQAALQDLWDGAGHCGTDCPRASSKARDLHSSHWEPSPSPHLAQTATQLHDQ